MDLAGDLVQELATYLGLQVGAAHLLCLYSAATRQDQMLSFGSIMHVVTWQQSCCSGDMAAGLLRSSSCWAAASLMLQCMPCCRACLLLRVPQVP